MYESMPAEYVYANLKDGGNYTFRYFGGIIVYVQRRDAALGGNNIPASKTYIDFTVKDIYEDKVLYENHFMHNFTSHSKNIERFINLYTDIIIDIKRHLKNIIPIEDLKLLKLKEECNHRYQDALNAFTICEFADKRIQYCYTAATYKKVLEEINKLLEEK